MDLSVGKIKKLLPFSGLLLLAGALLVTCGSLPRQRSVCEIQGTGLNSPYGDQKVITSGIVSWIHPAGDQAALLDLSCPLGEEGSRGILIMDPAQELTFQEGDEIKVTGIVREIAGETRLQVEAGKVTILSLANPLPDPVNLNAYFQAPGYFRYEDWEGELISISSGALEECSRSSSECMLVPWLDSPTAGELVCFSRESISLQLLAGAEILDQAHLVSEPMLEDVIGLLRQDDSGYLLQLLSARLPPPDDELAARDEYPVDLDQRVREFRLQSTTPTVTVEESSTPYPSLTPSVTIFPSPTYYPLPLLISEVLPNPSGDEPAGEWVEIYNSGGSNLPLDGVKLGDETAPNGKEGMLRFPDGYRIAAGDVLVVANQSQAFESRFGFRPDFEMVDSDSRVPDLLPYAGWGRSSIKFSNSADEVLLVSPWDGVLDMMVYGSSNTNQKMKPVPAPVEGHSLERYPPEVDSNQPEDWRERQSPSPGRLDRTPPTQQASLTPLITPSLTLLPSPTSTITISSTPLVSTKTPATSGTPSPTWTEIIRLTPSPTLSPEPTQTTSPSSTFFPTFSPTFTIQPCSPTSSATVPGPSPTSDTATATSSPGVTATPSLTPSQSLTPTWTFTPTLTATAKPVPTLNPTPTTTGLPDTPSAPSATPSPQNTKTSTPGMTVESSPTSTLIGNESILIINEIHADPDPLAGDSNGDGVVSSDDDEFLELVNISAGSLDLAGWKIFDGVRLRYTFPDETVLSAGCGLVLFGGGMPGGDFSGSLIFTAGSLGLNNSGDTVQILDADGELQASCEYGPEGGENQSLTRNPDLTGSLPLVAHSLIPAAKGALFSPGVRIDGTQFGFCP